MTSTTTFKGKRVGYDWPVQRVQQNDDITIPAKPHPTAFRSPGGCWMVATHLGMTPDDFIKADDLLVVKAAFTFVIAVCVALTIYGLLAA